MASVCLLFISAGPELTGSQDYSDAANALSSANRRAVAFVLHYERAAVLAEYGVPAALHTEILIQWNFRFPAVYIVIFLVSQRQFILYVVFPVF